MTFSVRPLPQRPRNEQISDDGGCPMVPPRRASRRACSPQSQTALACGAARVAKRRLRRLADIRRLRREVELVCPAIHHLRAGLGRDISRDLSWLGPARWLAAEVGRIRGRFAATIVRCHDDDSARNQSAFGFLGVWSRGRSVPPRRGQREERTEFGACRTPVSVADVEQRVAGAGLVT